MEAQSFGFIAAGCGYALLSGLSLLPLLTAVYLYSSIPFGLYLSKFFLKIDVRDQGSGNIGTTNVLRTGSKKIAFFTLLLDATKACVFIIVFFGMYLFDTRYRSGPDKCPAFGVYPDIISFNNPYLILICLFAVIGHCFPIWLKFKGGKGVATALGGLLIAVPFAGLAAAAAWIVTAFLFKISSLAALVAVGIAPIVTYFVYGAAPATVCFLITLLVWFRHKDNIKRLIAGTEPKIGAK